MNTADTCTQCVMVIKIGGDIEKRNTKDRIIATIQECQIQIETHQKEIDTLRQPSDGVEGADKNHRLDHVDSS